MTQNKPYLVGLTGGIASGKSTAINYIQMRGYEVIDFDKISHDILNSKEISEKLIKEFGKKIVSNNKIDRKKLSNIVFSDKSSLIKLNEITHKIIFDKANEEIQHKNKEKIIFLDIPLLFETKKTFKNFYSQIDEIWVISSNERVQTTRLMIRDKIDIEEATNKIKAQMNLKIKERMGDVIFYNNSDIYSLYEDLRIELNNLEKRVKNA